MTVTGEGDTPRVLVVLANMFFAGKLKAEAVAAGYAYKGALGADGVLQAARVHHPAAVLLDLSKEDIDFAALVESLRADPGTKAIPVVAFCGHVDTDMLGQAHAWGCEVVTTNGEISRNFRGVLAKALEGPPAGSRNVPVVPLVTVLLAALLAGCGDEGAPEPADAGNQAPANDLPALVESMATNLGKQNAVLHQALDDWDALDEASCRRYWALLQEEVRIGDEFEALLRENPTWTQSMCQWWEARIQEVFNTNISLERRLNNATPGGDAPRRWSALLARAAGSREAAHDYLDLWIYHPGAPSNLYILCAKFGYVDD